MPKILHIITGLNNGGAEAVLYHLVSSDDENVHEVVSLMDAGLYGPKLEALGIRVHVLEMPRGGVRISGLMKLYRLIRLLQPDVIQTWMYHSDLIGGIVAWAAGHRSVVWGIHHSDLDENRISRSTRAVVKICALISGMVPRRIISCSEAGLKVHRRLGYSSAKLDVVPNGYDIRKFSESEEDRQRLRAEFGVGQHEVLLGMVARWHPHKDHRNLVAALGMLRHASPGRWRCLLIGPDVDEGNKTLMGLLQQHGVANCVTLLGPRADIPAVMNALDLHVLSSAGEAFPNVVAEAMACGTPCVVTNVGDAALIVGATGWVVPPSNPVALRDALCAAMRAIEDSSAWRARKAACRARIVEQFSLDRMVRAYTTVWRTAAKRG